LLIEGKKHVSITWHIYLAIGLIVIVFSALIDVKKMSLFIFCGIVFVILALIKYLKLKISESGKKEHKNNQHHLHKTSGHHSQLHPHKTKYVKCNSCGSVNHSHVSNCHKCKTRFK
jgi:hypothetical protein